MNVWKELEGMEGKLGRLGGKEVDTADVTGTYGRLVEENGVIPRVECHFESWVMAEGWPSWSYVLKSLGCRSLHTVVKGLTLEELLEVRETGLERSKVHSWTHVDKLLNMKSNAPRHMWIQGSQEFIAESLKLAKLYHILEYTCVIVEAKGLTGKSHRSTIANSASYITIG